MIFVFRECEREREREEEERERNVDARETHQVVASGKQPDWGRGTSPQPKYLTLRGLKPSTLWCAG